MPQLAPPPSNLEPRSVRLNPLIWMPLEERTASRIKAIHSAPNLQDESAWLAYFERLKKTGEEFAEVFGKYV